MIRLLVVLTLVLAGPAMARDRLVIQSTTSTEASGLYDHLLPLIEAATGVRPQVVAVGTGQALKNAERCDGDLLIVHARAAEEAFVAAGYGLARHDLMQNDFVLVGPADDPAGVARAGDLTGALRAIAAGGHFVSRGDDSGTHMAERRLWGAAGITPGDWLIESGQGMGATLAIAVATGRYTLTDRATWAAFGAKGGHAILFEGAPELANPYGLILVSPDHCPTVNAADAARVADWLLSPEGQAAIAAFRVAGAQVFFPAHPAAE